MGMQLHRVHPDITTLADQLEVPGIGHLAVNAFVLHASEAVVVDTGLGLPGRGFLDALDSALDLESVEWIWLTHPDRDHTGSLFELLARAPRARLITTFTGVGIMSTAQPLPMDRVYLLNPGQSLDVGDRTLTAFRPPLFDNPATIGFYDDRTHACFTSDCFGGPLATAELALSSSVDEIAPDELRSGQLLWAGVDSPWIHDVDPSRHAANIELIRAIDPALVLSTHLPAAVGRTNELLDTLALAPASAPFVGPDQATLEQMLAEMEGSTPSGNGFVTASPNAALDAR
jgi:glyoxylase-like metal-dependent hydrolase (beta-lactamase superfamily II)